ncbi:MAG: hypothetical protein AB9836_08220 [Aminipila sp.]
MDGNLMKIEMPKEVSTAFIYACMKFGSKSPDANSLELIKECSNIVLSSSEPRVVYKEFAIGIDPDSGEFYVGNLKNKLVGKAVAKHFAHCTNCVLVAVTLGPQIDKLIRRAQVTDMAKAVTLDACASSLIEDICDRINQHLIEEYHEKGMGMTTRFSPGYGDLPLDTQIIFSNLLEMEKKIGLTQSREHLLLPRKSITAIIGIFPLEEDKDNQQTSNVVKSDNSVACEICERKNQCQFRSNGGYCGIK